MATESLHLSVLDQNCPRVYTQTNLVFPFLDGNNAEAAITALKDGLRKALTKHAFIAGSLRLSNIESMRLSLTYPTEVTDVQDFGLFASKNIPLSSDFPCTYEQLKKNGMPPSAFKGEIFRPDELLKYPGIPRNGEGLVDHMQGEVPVMRVQANFIPGGLVLTTSVHHSVMDCSGIHNFWTYFAGEVCASTHFITELQAETLAPPPDQSSLRHELDARPSIIERDQQPFADAYVDGTYTYSKTLEQNTPCSVKLFAISAARIREYRDQLKPQFEEVRPLTICNVLAALIWIYVSRARAARLGDCGREITNIGIATDLRKRSLPRWDLSYMGNMALFSKGTMYITDQTTEECVTENTILHTVREIRRAIGTVTNDWVLRHLAFFKSIEQIKDTECALAFRFNRDIYVTSWMNFAAEIQWGIPGTDLGNDSLNGRPDYIRRMYGSGDGGMMIMPRRRSLVYGKEAPYEITIKLATVDMNTLMEERGGLTSWAERVID